MIARDGSDNDIGIAYGMFEIGIVKFLAVFERRKAVDDKRTGFSVRFRKIDFRRRICQSRGEKLGDRG